MIYLDYSATTPVDEDVLNTFNKASLEFLGNANSLHNLGNKCQTLIDNASMQIANILKIKPQEIIYTSGATEANNLAIKGISYQYQNRGKHIITSKFEHSSVIESLKSLEKNGFEITYLDTNANGIIAIENLAKVLRKDTILVTINAVNSEIGLKQPVEEIGKYLNENAHCFFHVDLTQAIGKIPINLENIDLASFSSHKIYGLKGIGALIKKEKIQLMPLINGGKSTTIYRSGTPMHPLIASLAKSLRLSMENLEERMQKVTNLNNYLQKNLKLYPHVFINSNEYSIPHILNISLKNIKAETFMHALEKYNVYVSTKTACSDNTSFSENVYDLTKDKELAKGSIRISISHLTTQEELEEFLKIFDKCYKELS